MEALAGFFDAINQLLGVKEASELVWNPYFLGLMLAMFIYALVKRWKVFYLGIAGIMGIAICVKYLYPEDTSNLFDLIKFLAACGGVGVVLIFLGLIRD
ncbi:MAG: hypothetical protein AB1646_14775 [Thermodesulfobacteriota bacterium]